MITKEIEDYIINHSEVEEEILQKINRETNAKMLHPRMLSGALQGQVLKMLTKMIRPKNVLEIGTFTGYSAISIALALEKNSIITTIDINDEIKDFTQKFIDESNLNKKIKFIIGDALEVIPKLQQTFDLVFIDGEKNEYLKYYNTVFDKINKGGYIIADNVLWSGKVIEKKIKNNDYFTKGIIEFNKSIQNDKRVENVIFPIRDGLMIIRKK